jgi:ribulose-phosphate 3-epimerase
MDGQFVPAITIGWPVVEAVRRVTDLVLDIHLMVVQPESQVRQFVDAGGDIINVHVEAAHDLPGIVETVHGLGRQAGVCLNPATPVSAVEGILPEIDQVMVMSVNPGRSGQSFIESALQKIEQLRQEIDSRGFRALIEVDGGVGPATAPGCVAAGADVLVAASAVFNDAGTIAENVGTLRDSFAAIARSS